MFKFYVSFIVLVLTLLIVTTEPKMHKRVIIGSQLPNVETESFKTQNVNIVPQNIKTETETVKVVQQKVVPDFSSINFATVDDKTDVISQNVTSPKVQVQKNDINRDEYMRSIKLKEKQQITSVERETLIRKTDIQPQKKSEPEPDKESVETTMKKLNEIIVWNKWRADICNTISDNSLAEQVYYLKKGVLFKYRFNVDKRGHITDINVYLARGTYNDVVRDSIQDIHKTIRSLEGSDIIKFPAGSQRTTVQVEGGIEMGGQDINLSPGFFNDIESITH